MLQIAFAKYEKDRAEFPNLAFFSDGTCRENVDSGTGTTNAITGSLALADPSGDIIPITATPPPTIASFDCGNYGSFGFLRQGYSNQNPLASMYAWNADEIVQVFDVWGFSELDPPVNIPTSTCGDVLKWFYFKNSVSWPDGGQAKWDIFFNIQYTIFCDDSGPTVSTQTTSACTPTPITMPPYQYCTECKFRFFCAVVHSSLVQLCLLILAVQSVCFPTSRITDFSPTLPK